jgi:ribosome-associated protein
LEAIDDRKGIDPVVLNVKGISCITDLLVIATGSSPPHLKALGDEIEHALKQGGERCHHRSGSPESGWIVLDYVDMVVHLLSPEARAYYALEKLWGDAETWRPVSG